MASSTVFSRARTSSKVGVEYDQEGKAINVETREDEEQQLRFTEIIDLLVAAGYFRARIKGLSPFDKVVGGMTWCISNCNVDIDVDLLFQENSSIGQKISLTEKIVKVLPKMKCPHPIEPHQIQGLDFKSIFPVIQWLVKRVIETREEMGDHIRAYSISQFNKHYKTQQDIDLEEQGHLRRLAIDRLHDVYRPTRKYKRDDKSSLVTEEARVSSTLLEYGLRTAVRAKSSKEDENKENTSKQMQKAKPSMKDEIASAFTKVSKETSKEENAEDEEETIRLAQEKTLHALMGGMSEMSGREREGKLATKVVGSIVEMQSSEIQEISNLFAQRKKDMIASVTSKPLSPAQQHAQVVEKLQEKMSAKQKLVEEVKSTFNEVAAEKQKLEDRLSEVQQEQESLEKEMFELQEQEDNADKNVLQDLRNLISMNENLKQQETLFKQHCKEESIKMTNEIDSLKQDLAERSSAVDDNESLVQKQYNEDSQKLAKIRLLLASKNRQVAALTRKIDEVPTRAELTQYQRRFVELYDQIASTHKETKQFYTMYNTLDDSRRYLEKEVDLLDSIYDNFQAAKSSSANMLQYLKQFEKIVEGVKSNKIKVEKQKQMEKMKRDELNEKYLELVEKHRLYVKTIRDFQEECRKNEILYKKLNY